VVGCIWGKSGFVVDDNVAFGFGFGIRVYHVALYSLLGFIQFGVDDVTGKLTVVFEKLLI
jgi:hypothetical protein